MSTTKIEWATHVLNAFTGCDRVSAGCASCYAIPTAAANKRRELGRARVAREKGKSEPVMRYQLDGDPRTSGPGFGFAVHWDKLLKPPRFPAGARVFVNSMSDVFHEDAPLDAIAALWCVFLRQPEVDWLVLTKRADRMRDVLNNRAWWESVGALMLGEGRDDVHVEWHGDGLPAPANVYLGVTVENRAFVHRADDLRATPAAVRYISAEPLLGPLDDPVPCPLCAGGGCHDCDAGTVQGPRALDFTDINWLIVGGESKGRVGRRLVDDADQPRADRIGWVRWLRDACLVQDWRCECGDLNRYHEAFCYRCGAGQPEAGAPGARTAYFFKQWGGARPTSGGRLLDGRTWDEIPSRADHAARAAARP